jgi:hypothetical protein
MTKSKKQFFGNHLKIGGGDEARFFQWQKKQKTRNVNSLGIIFDFHVFIFYRQERYGRRVAAPPPNHDTNVDMQKFLDGIFDF